MIRVDYRLYLVTDQPEAYPQGLLNRVAAAVDGGVTLVQYRPTQGTKRAWYDEALALQALLRARHVPLIINDHLDLALAVDADGLHLGQNDLPIEVARKLLGSTKILGLSITEPRQVQAPEVAFADYLGAGPVFPTSTKADAAPALGLTALREITMATELPVVAIGGITLSNTEAVLAAGVDGVAVVSALSRVQDPAAAARSFISCFSSAA